MHILYLSADRGIPVRGHKGAAVHVRALTDALVAAGHRVTIFTPRPGPADGLAPRAEIVECPLPDPLGSGGFSRPETAEAVTTKGADPLGSGGFSRPETAEAVTTKGAAVLGSGGFSRPETAEAVTTKGAAVLGSGGLSRPETAEAVTTKGAAVLGSGGFSRPETAEAVTTKGVALLGSGGFSRPETAEAVTTKGVAVLGSGGFSRPVLAWLADNPCDAIYERYSLWSDVGARLRAATGLPFILEVNAPLRVEAARHRTLHDDELAARIEATQFAAADFIAVVSQPLADYVIAHGADPARVHVVPNAVDPQRFHPAVDGSAVRQRYSLHGRIVVGFAGRLRPWHDGPTLLRAFQRLHTADPAYHLLLVGEMAPEFLAAIEAAGLAHAVTCTGPIPHDQVPEHLAAMDVAVSSHAAAEAGEAFYFSPLKLFEYLACGVPTVAADVGQPAELIRPGHNGYLYPPGDDAALAAAIQALVNAPAHAATVAWNGATMVLREYTWAQNAARIVSWLQERSHHRGPQAQNAPARALSAQVVGVGDGRLRPTNGHGASTPSAPAVAPTAPPLPILDDKLRRKLYRATRADLAAPLLARDLPGLGEDSPNELEGIASIEVLKYKPGRRCVLGYELACRHRASGQPIRRRVIGKVFRDERGLRLLALQRRLWRTCFSPDGVNGISVPQPLAYVPEMRMVVQASAPGLRLDELSLRGPIAAQVLRCAEALAWLHRCQALAGPPGNGRSAADELATLRPYTLADELRGLEDYTARLAQVRPDALPAVLALRAALLDWAGTLPAAPRCAPLHRDFYYGQVLFDGSDLYLIDFDLLALGDPAIDVANFSAHLAYLGLEQFGNPHRFAGEAERFAEAYGAAGVVDATFWQRVAFYRGTTLYRLLNVVAPRPTVRHLFEPLLTYTQAAVPGRRPTGTRSLPLMAQMA